MLQTMFEQSCELNYLITALPADYSYKCVSELNSILSKYIKILDYVNSYNHEYKSVTRVYYSDIPGIRDRFEQLLTENSLNGKTQVFECTKNELKSDLHALSVLIKQAQELV